MTDDVIAESMAEATIHAPLTAIDLTEWVFTLTDSEYQACSKNHIAAAVTVTPLPTGGGEVAPQARM
jgi:hypothetical protein